MDSPRDRRSRRRFDRPRPCLAPRRRIRRDRPRHSRCCRHSLGTGQPSRGYRAGQPGRHLGNECAQHRADLGSVYEASAPPGAVNDRHCAHVGPASGRFGENRHYDVQACRPVGNPRRSAPRRRNRWRTLVVDRIRPWLLPDYARDGWSSPHGGSGRAERDGACFFRRGGVL